MSGHSKPRNGKLRAETRQNLRILLLYDRIYPESLGGVEHRNLELAKVLADRGHHVTLAGFCRTTEIAHPGLSIFSLGPPPETYNTDKRSTGAAIQLALACVKLDITNYDLIECANIPYAHLPALAAKCRWHRKPLMVTWYEFWGRYFKEYLGPWIWMPYAMVEWFSGQLGQRAVAVSGLTERRLKECRFGGKVDLVPCGLSLETVLAAVERGDSQGPPLIYAGRLLAEKRVDLLLQAISHVRFSSPGPLLTVIGEGAESQNLRSLAHRLGIDEKVQFLGYLESNEDVWSHLRGARIAVQPSSREGFGLFPLEAMAAGIPVVYCESSENAVMELVHHGVHGICTQATPQALAQALDALLENEEECLRLGSEAARHAQTFDWQHVANRFEDLAGQMITSKG